MTAHPPRLRIACSGVVGVDHGSVASANFGVLQELLRRGHEVDFFSNRAYVYPEQLVCQPTFTYHDRPQPTIDNVIGRIPGADARRIGGQIGNAVFTRRVMGAMAEQHLARRYDVALFVGLWAYGRVPRLPVVSWVQGPPGTDVRSVIHHGATIRRLCGWAEYAQLRVYAGYRGSRLGLPRFGNSDVVICGSAVSRQTLTDHYPVPATAVRVLPYPVDLDVFRPAKTDLATRRAEMLWIGRVVPRKRLDLFLDAGAHLIRAGIDVELKVIGGYEFARGYHKLIERFPFPERLTYTEHVGRDEVRRHLKEATVLVQPSEEENFGSSVAEALACGVPVVLGPSNGTGEYMGGGGRRFDEYSVVAVANAVERVLRLSTAGREAMRSAGRHAAVNYFAVDRIVDGLEAILRSAAARPAA